MSGVDLHLHTTISDGALEPAELVRRAVAEARLAIAVSDHDTVAALGEVGAAAARAPVPLHVIPALELTAQVEGAGSVHVLGYGVRPDDPTLAAVTARNRAGKRARLAAILTGLQTREGISIDYEELAAGRGPDAYVGRHHAAAALVRRGLVKKRQKAFQRYLRDDRVPPADVVGAVEGIAAIHAAGGVAVLAHPTGDDLRRHLRPLLAAGLDGIEVHRARGAPAHKQRVAQAAERHGLLVTGGSDWHGHYPDPPFGHWSAPESLLPGLLAAIEARGGLARLPG